MSVHDAVSRQEQPPPEAPNLAPKTIEAQAQTRAGYGVPIEEVVAWVDSWDTDNELPKPRARKLD
jgi:hypothetical protein